MKPNTTKGKRIFRCSYTCQPKLQHALTHTSSLHISADSQKVKKKKKKQALEYKIFFLPTTPFAFCKNLSAKARCKRVHFGYTEKGICAHHYPSTIAGDVKRAIALREVRIPPYPNPRSWHLLHAQTSAQCYSNSSHTHSEDLPTQPPPLIKRRGELWL